MPSQISLKYAFILGHVPDLSKAEIVSVLGKQDIGFKEIFSNKEILLLAANQELDVKGLQERLGGVIKIIDILGQAPGDNVKESIEELVTQNSKLKTQNFKSKLKSNRFQFGFSLYGKADVKEFKEIGLAIKRRLKEEGVSCRLVVSKEKSLSSVIVKKERLLEQGMDVVIIENQEQYYLGQTVAVQDFKDYSLRDYGRPNRDDKSGMLPPKLAKIMINLSGAESNKVILDPFCGSGTILQEALLMGYQNIIGSDISAKAVSDSQNNINWLKAKYQLDISGVKIFQADARSLADKIKPESINAIVTEPYLGESQKSKVKSQSFGELENLYLDSFREFYKVLKNDGRIVITLPIINGEKMEILNRIEKIGFSLDKLSADSRGSIVYGREGQRVEREIFVFRK